MCAHFLGFVIDFSTFFSVACLGVLPLETSSGWSYWYLGYPVNLYNNKAGPSSKYIAKNEYYL